MPVKALATLRRALPRLGYPAEHLEDGESQHEGRPVPWVAGYVRRPFTSRNACVVALADSSPSAIDQVLSATGAPVALVPGGEEVALWRKTPTGADLFDTRPKLSFAQPGDELRRLLDPRSIHRAKTLGRFDGSYQLSFVDVGLLQQIEQTQGDELRKLLERIVEALRQSSEKVSDEQAHQVLTVAFWLLAARMLRDHQVPAFADVTAGTVLDRVALHYGGAVPVLGKSSRWKARIGAAFDVAQQSGLNLGKIGPEAIGYVYESALIADKTRKDLGTHSTPPFLVEYVLGRLRKSIQSIPVERRLVVEPACGHGAFLVAALQMLAEDVPEDDTRHDYLRQSLRGLDIDHAAKEMARLSLTLADVPNPDGWELREGDMFEGDALANLARGGTILLANPPFEDFKSEERAQLARNDEGVLSNKAAEMLRRVLPALERDAVIGVVVPRQLLSSPGARSLRRALLESFELIEICLFPDKVFRYADHGCAVILARGKPGGTRRNSPVAYRRVREPDLERFREQATVSSEEVVPGSVFRDSEDANLAIPEVRRLWISRRWSKLSEIATVDQGMSYDGSVRKTGHETVRHARFEGSERGVAAPGQSPGALITEAPPYNYMDMNRSHIRRARGGLPTGQPQVVLNYHMHSRGPWRLMAFMEPRGAAVPATRIAVWPRDAETTVEMLWAICNSPVANAFVYAHFGKRDVTVGLLRQLPIPDLPTDFCDDLTRMVRSFILAAKERPEDEPRLRELLASIDAAVLGAYGLFAPDEQRLLALFEGQERPGLPFKATSVGRESRLPQYLGVPGLNVDMPPVALDDRLGFVPDLDAAIDDGRRELAELRRAAASGDPRVNAREAYVRSMIQALEERAADIGIPLDSRGQ
jgi:type I restriction-modification system DNA methylase subunit